MQHKNVAALAVVGLATLFLAACAEQQPPITRLDPNYMRKAWLVGEKLQDTSDDPEFYTQATITDSGMGSGVDYGLYTSNHSEKLARVQFDIQEDYIIARLAFELFEGGDGKKGAVTGTPVGMWKVSDHFDIEYQYNPVTGERNNVLSKNYDRPWYERQYIDIDWSENKLPSYEYDLIYSMTIWGDAKITSVNHAVNRLEDDQGPRYDVKQQGQSGESLEYFDVIQKYLVEAPTLDFSMWGIPKFPACIINNGTTTCDPTEMTVRLAFRKIEETDYQPENWDGIRFQAFGAFTTDRRAYDREYGIPDDGWFRLISRYNIWERSHFYSDRASMQGPIDCNVKAKTPAGLDPNRDEVDAEDNQRPNGTADECEVAGQGSQCDTFSHKCTLPFRSREVKPIVWHVTDRSDYRYFDGTAWAAQDWDVAMRHAVMVARYAECARDVESNRLIGVNCADQYPVLKGQGDEQLAAIQLTTEVDACRNGLAWEQYRGGAVNRWGQPTCDSLISYLQEQNNYSDEVAALAREDEVVILCHSPVEASDHPLCVRPGEASLPLGKTAAECSDIISKGVDLKGLRACRCADGGEVGAACAKPITAARIGDIRFNTVNLIPGPQDGSPWGVMQDASDPLTGEKVSSSINVWTNVNDVWAKRLVDKIRYIRNELTDADVTEGKYIKDWATAAKATSALPTMSLAEAKQRLSSVAGSVLIEAQENPTGIEARSLKQSFGEGILSSDPQTVKASLDRGMNAIHNGLLKSEPRVSPARMAIDLISSIKLGPTYLYSTHFHEAKARRTRAIGSAIEGKLMAGPEMLKIVAASGMTGLDLKGYGVTSIFQAADPGFILAMDEFRENAVSNSGRCIMKQAPMPIATAALADELERKFSPFNPADSTQTQQDRADKMAVYVGQRAQYNVIAHEAGHSFGLRHNFVSSSDALNYRPQYWFLRSHNSAGAPVTAECTEGKTVAEAENCVGPRYFDPMTSAENDNLIQMFMQSSIMDYGGEAAQDFIGLGVYDFAATRMFYGGTSAVLASTENAYDPQLVPSARGMKWFPYFFRIDNFGGILGFAYNNWTNAGREFIHYSQLQKNLDLVSDCKPVGTGADIREKYQPKTWNEDLYGKWDPLLDGLFVSPQDNTVDVDSKTFWSCKAKEVDYVQWEALNNPVEWMGPFVDSKNRMRVPYGFATDNYADLGNLSVYRHDNGADAYELFDFMIMSQEADHIFSNYRRRLSTFDPFGAAKRTLSRYNGKMRDAAKGMGLFFNLSRSFSQWEGLNYNDAVTEMMRSPMLKSNALASTIAFDYFTRQLGRPQAGPHFDLDYYGDKVLRSSDDDFFDFFERLPYPRPLAMTVPNGVYGSKFKQFVIGGRPLETALMPDGECGYYCVDYYVNSGSYYEKMFVPMLLTESVDNFVSSSRGDFLDARARNIGMADVFPEGFRRWLANNLTGDDFLKGQRVMATGGLPNVTRDANKYPTEGFAWTSWLPVDGPKSCLDAELNLGELDANQNAICKELPPTAETIVVDPQVGFQQQMHLIVETMIYLPENRQTWWLEKLGLWKLGYNSDPGFPNRIEYRSPTGSWYVAKSIGKEQIFGRMVEKGVSARVLEWANTLLRRAYVTTESPDGDWAIPTMSSSNVPIVKFDSGMPKVDGTFPAGCSSESDNLGCTCEQNRACMELQQYEGLISFMHQSLALFGWTTPGVIGEWF